MINTISSSEPLGERGHLPEQKTLAHGPVSRRTLGTGNSDSAQPQPLAWDVRGAASRLSISPVTVRKLVRQQRLARLPNIRKLLIPEDSLRKLVATAE